MISLHRYEEGARHNEALCALLRQQRAHVPSSRADISRSGWTGPKTLLLEECMRHLRDFIVSCLPAGAWSLCGWGNVLGAGDVIDWHDHVYTHNVWAGVYYPHGGGGSIEFEGIRYEPEESMLLLFPAHLKHRALARSERISMAFNVAGKPALT